MTPKIPVRWKNPSLLLNVGSSCDEIVATLIRIH